MRDDRQRPFLQRDAAVRIVEAFERAARARGDAGELRVGPPGEDEGPRQQDIEPGRADELPERLVEPLDQTSGHVCSARASTLGELVASGVLDESSDRGARLQEGRIYRRPRRKTTEAAPERHLTQQPRSVKPCWTISPAITRMLPRAANDPALTPNRT